MKKFWAILRKYIINKYVLVVLIFGAVMFFVGEQSIRVRWHKSRQIKELKEQRDTYKQAIDEAKHELQVLQSTDSLERFAREKYLMHTDKEDVYLIDEDD